MSDKKPTMIIGEKLASANVPTIFCDKFHQVQIGPAVSKISLTDEAGKPIALVIVPTLAFIETMMQMTEIVTSNSELGKTITSQLDILKNKFGTQG